MILQMSFQLDCFAVFAHLIEIILEASKKVTCIDCDNVQMEKT